MSAGKSTLRGGYQRVWNAPGQKFSQLVHVVGPQGANKAVVSDQLVAQFRAQGKTALRLAAFGYQDDGQLNKGLTFNNVRQTPIRLPYADEAVLYDFLIVEHNEEPKAYMLMQGEQIHRVRRQA